MFCTNCGKEITQRASFCTGCGAPLSWPDAPKSVIPEEMKQTPAPEMPVFETPAAAPEENAAQSVPENKTTELVPEMPAAQPIPEMPAEIPVASEIPKPLTPSYEEPAWKTPAPPAAPKKKKSGKGGKIALIIVTAVLALALIGAGIYCYLLYSQCSLLADEVTALQNENEALISEKSDLQDSYDMLADDYNYMFEEWDFYTTHGVFCSEDNNYYHSYDCPDWDRSNFWLFNSEYAKYKEYQPCPYCQ